MTGLKCVCGTCVIADMLPTPTAGAPLLLLKSAQAFLVYLEALKKEYKVTGVMFPLAGKEGTLSDGI